MKFLILLSMLSISGFSVAETARLGQDPDPVGGDNSRCCRTGKCGDNMRICADTQIDADRSPKDVYVSSSNKKKSKSSKATAQ